MCRENIKMINICGKIPSKTRLEKIGIHQLMKGQFMKKNFIFREIWKIPCVVEIFPVMYLNSLCFPVWKKWLSNSLFPCAVATLTFAMFGSHILWLPQICQTFPVFLFFFFSWSVFQYFVQNLLTFPVCWKFPDWKMIPHFSSWCRNHAISHQGKTADTPWKA